jgi:hypothetical protein
MSKRRSGLANHRRAYCIYCSIPCPSVTLGGIATFDGTNWLLNQDTTILECQTLEIPAGQELQTNHFTLTNNGTINVRGTIRNAQDTLGSNSVTVNNGTINIFPTGTIVAVDGGSIITNNGVVNNYGDFYCQTHGVINNNAGGQINNYSADSGGNGGFRVNALGTFNNYGLFINKNGATIIVIGGGSDGIINNNYGGTIINQGTITIGNIANSGGIIYNYSTLFTNNGTISISYSGTFNNTWDGVSSNDPILTNNGNINILVASGTLNNSRAILNNNSGGAITNLGTITNSEATINNNTGGIITNNDSIQNNISATINNNIGATIDGTGAIFNTDSTSIITNIGTITVTGGTGGIQNSGTIYVNGGTINLDLTSTGGILNNGTLFVYQGGTITGSASAQIYNNTTISQADGSGSCGIGYITIVSVAGSGIANNNCPP